MNDLKNKNWSKFRFLVFKPTTNIPISTQTTFQTSQNAKRQKQPKKKIFPSEKHLPTKLLFYRQNHKETIFKCNLFMLFYYLVHRERKMFAVKTNKQINILNSFYFGWNKEQNENKLECFEREYYFVYTHSRVLSSKKKKFFLKGLCHAAQCRCELKSITKYYEKFFGLK